MSSCPICLEPFFPTEDSSSTLTNKHDESGGDDERMALGAVDPCGHIFHFHCFALWKANTGNRCKCPQCNQPAKKCIKLFGLAQPNGGSSGERGDLDDDSFTASSQDEDSELEQEIPGASANAGHDDDENSVELVEIVPAPGLPSEIVNVDMRSKKSDWIPRPTKSSKGEPSGDIRRYRRTAKKYRSLFKQKDSQCRELNLQRQSLIELHSSTKEENKQLRAEQEARQELSELKNAQLDAANLKVVRLMDDLKRIKARIQCLTQERDDWNTKYDDLQRSFRIEVQRVKTSDMAEVQQMMEERQKLLADNNRLIREHAAAVLRESKVRAILRQAVNKSEPSSVSQTRERPVDPSAFKAMTSIFASVPDKKRKASNIAKGLRDMEDARFSTIDTPTVSRDGKTATTPALVTKMSARSILLMEKARQQQAKRDTASSRVPSDERTNHTQQRVLADRSNGPIISEPARRISLDSVEEPQSIIQSRPPSIGLKFPRSHTPFLKRR